MLSRSLTRKNMQIDALIQKRLGELEAKAQAIVAAKFSATTGRIGGNRTVDYVPRPETVAWGTSVLSLFRQAFGEDSIHTQHFSKAFENTTNYLSAFKVCYAVFKSAKEDYEGGYMFSLRGLVKAEVLSDALDQAAELLKAGYKDPACVLIGVSLEVAIKHLASKYSVPLGKLDKMNADLSKAMVYNIAKQKQVTAWADLRNKAAHGDWPAYTKEDILDMHSGVQRFIADFL